MRYRRTDRSRSSRGVRLVIGVVVTMSLAGCVDTASAPSPVTADPHVVAAVAVKISAASPDFAPYSGCLAYEAAKHMSAQELAAFDAAHSLETPDGHMTDVARSIFGPCISTNELATIVIRTATSVESGPALNDAETRCAVSKLVANPKFGSTGALLDAFDTKADASTKLVITYVASCIGPGSLAAFLQRVGGGRLSAGMSLCVTNQLIHTYGSASNAMQKIIAADPGVDAASAAAARACLAAGQR